MERWRNDLIDLRQVLRSSLVDARTGWGMGPFKTADVFRHGEGEGQQINLPALFERAGRDGAIRLHSDIMGRVVPVAYESLGPGPDCWDHALALCLPPKDAARSNRSVLTELGPDGNAVCEENRQTTLFDLGLGLPACDVCLRTGDPGLLAVLRASLGRSLFDPGNRALRTILQTRADGVVLTRIGRIEMYRMDFGPVFGRSLPADIRVLRQVLPPAAIGLTDAPIPEGLVPLGYLRPAHPAMDRQGTGGSFNIDDHARFQGLFERYARADLHALRMSVLEALARDADPASFSMPPDRFSRATLRITLRQQHCLAEKFGSRVYSALIARWRGIFDAVSEPVAMDARASGPRGEIRPASKPRESRFPALSALS